MNRKEKTEKFATNALIYIMIFILLMFFSLGAQAQVIDDSKKLENKIVKKYKVKNFFEDVYKDILKYSTIYVAGDIDNPKENPKDYFVRTNPNGNLYSAPVVVDGTDYYDFYVGPITTGTYEPHDRATLVWNRHAEYSGPHYPYAYSMLGVHAV